MPVSGTPKEIIGEEMHRFKHGQLHSGPDKYGHLVKNRKQAVAIALDVARRAGRAAGGGTPWFVKQEARSMLHTGPIRGPVAGRTDHVPLTVPNGSYVLPADFVSHMGQNNTAAGHARISGMFAHGHLPGAPGIKGGAPKPPGLPKASSKGAPSIFADGGIARAYADGGLTPYKAGGVTGDNGDGVDIMGAAGEHVLSPEEVAMVGMGNVEHGHRILDEWVKRVRKDHVKTLQKLPGPATD